MEDGMKALALVDSPGHVCCRYRIRAFEPAALHAGWLFAHEALARGPLARLLQFARAGHHDCVILQRKLLPGWQLAALRRQARRLVFDFDDAVLYRDSYDPRGPFSPRRARRFAATVRAADAVMAGNDFLADCALRAGARPERVRVVPTCIAVDDYEPKAARDGFGIELVWIGSSSTLKGLQQQRALWERLAAEVPGIRLRVICDRFPDLGSMPVVKVAWTEAAEAAALAAGDVGVSWVPDDLWSRGKCGLKVLQYQAAGLPVLANPVGVHSEMIEPGVNGWLPSTPDAWVAAARALASDASLRRRMGGAARASVEAGYSVSAWQATFLATLSGSDPGATAIPAANLRGLLAAKARERAGRGSIGAKG
jgi:glycosyltransferase involved in cell wall biosynthesis